MKQPEAERLRIVYQARTRERQRRYGRCVTMKRCASCKIEVEPHNWVRLVSGFLLCMVCYYKGPK